MATLSEIKASNARITEETMPRVAVFVGATAGIGKATLALLVSKKIPIKAYIIGRNGEKHKAFLDELRQSNDKADIVWLEGQVSLLADTKRLCEEIKAREKTIELLFMSAGFLSFEGRKGKILLMYHYRAFSLC
jgi:NADP-dependent 3-hydroxy acid dehydrogenase YdfG